MTWSKAKSKLFVFEQPFCTTLVLAYPTLHICHTVWHTGPTMLAGTRRAHEKIYYVFSQYSRFSSNYQTQLWARQTVGATKLTRRNRSAWATQHTAHRCLLRACTPCCCGVGVVLDTYTVSLFPIALISLKVLPIVPQKSLILFYFLKYFTSISNVSLRKSGTIKYLYAYGCQGFMLAFYVLSICLHHFKHFTPLD